MADDEKKKTKKMMKMKMTMQKKSLLRRDSDLERHPYQGSREAFPSDPLHRLRHGIFPSNAEQI